MNTAVQNLIVVGLLAASANTQAQRIPGGVDSVGLTNIVPDMALWYHSSNYFTNGPVKVASQVASLDTWEPYIGLMGDSTFLISANTFVDDGKAENMRPALVFQPAAGGPVKLSTMFYDDSGHPYTNKHHEFSAPQSGNLGRVGGDLRLGATNFLCGVAVAFYNYPTYFNSDGRFDVNGPFYSTLAAANGRATCVQSYSLDPNTLVQTPLSKAIDSTFGNCCTNASYPAATQTQLARLQHSLGLSDGNFVAVVEDRSELNNPDANAAVVTILRPNGSIVKSAFKVANGDLWSNVAAFREGFCVRVSGVFYFYDNTGNLQGSVDESTSSLPFSTDRGDSTRIASDIRSDYVYLAGVTPVGESNLVSVAIWDARSRKFVTSATVTDTDPTIHTVDQVNLAVDALDRFCVAYALKPTTDFQQFQVAARVMAFNGTNVSSLTASFFPFTNHDTNGTLGILTANPGVAMTTRQICISGNGIINSTNNPAGGADTSPETDLYTVISHPDPKPTPGSSGPTITGTTMNGKTLTITWTGGTAPYLLQKKLTVADPSWQTVSTNQATSASVQIEGAAAFFRVNAAP